MAYATFLDIESRTTRTFTSEEEELCEALLEDAAVLIDSYNSEANDNVKLIVSCRMVIRAVGDGNTTMQIPLGASQGSMSALGYSQSWTMGTGGAVGELYLSGTEKRMLGKNNKIGSYSPIEELAGSSEE